MRSVPATEFKARCLELMDRVAERRETYLVTKRGRPIAKLAPAERRKTKSVFGCLADQTAFVGKLDRTPWREEDWKEFERQRAAQSRAWEREWRRYGTIASKKTVGVSPRTSRRRVRSTRSGRRSKS